MAADAATVPDGTGLLDVMKALGTPINLAFAGEPGTSGSAAAVVNGTPNRSFHVNSFTGDDARDGLSAEPGPGSSGPWRSLGRLAAIKLQPGDKVVLACASVWRETLKLAVAGSADRPIVVTAPAEGCAVPPTIDGGRPIRADEWVKVRTGVYEAPLPEAPRQLHGERGPWHWAHHPNRGHDAQRPGSVYLPMAGNGRTTVADGRSRGTSFVTGAELRLPAGARLEPGTTVRLRTNAWTVEERKIKSSAGAHHELDYRTNYPALTGWGYFLLGQPWMVDSAGEWAWDPARKTVVAYWPEGNAPAGETHASILDTGLDLRGSSHLRLEGLRVHRVGVGARLADSHHVQLHKLQIADTAAHGVLVTGSTDTTLTSNVLLRTGKDAILGAGEGGSDALRLVARGNLVTNSGVIVEGDAVSGLPGPNLAAINAGASATVTDNVLVNTGYIGIRFGAGSTLERNFVFGACTVIDDCGGIYTWGTNGSVLRSNIVIRSRGNVNGKPLASAKTAAQGIYLDDGTNGVLVEGNTVVDADHGMQVHNAFQNTIRDNRLVGNRRSQIWFQEDRRQVDSLGDLFGNLIERNTLAPTSPLAAGLWLDSIYDSTERFGRFAGNRHVDVLSASPVIVNTAAGRKVLSTAQWVASSGLGSTLPLDADGFSQRALPYTQYLAAGNNLIDNSRYASGLTGWSHWNELAPKGSLVREPCAAGLCARYLPGGSAGLVSSPTFTITQGQWYRLSVDLRAETDGQAQPIVVRRGGGGANGYEVLSDRALTAAVGRAWQRHSFLFQATKSVQRRDPVTGDNGARVDFTELSTGRGLSVANLELVPIEMDPAALVVAALVNATAAPQSLACPVAAPQSAGCAALHTASSLQPAAWPTAVPAFSSEVLFAAVPALLDNDRDGIADAQDRCPRTPPASATNAQGCAWGETP